MLKKTVLFLFISVVALILLRPYGLVTGVRTIDSPVAKLSTSLQRYARSVKTALIVDGPNGGDTLSKDALDLLGRLADRFGNPAAVPDRSSDTANSLAGAGSPERTGDFAVQVGVFRNPANAEELVRTLRENNYEVRSYLIGSDLHAVSVGPFEETRIAEEAAQAISDVTGLSPLVVIQQAQLPF